MNDTDSTVDADLKKCMKRYLLVQLILSTVKLAIS